MNEIEWYRVQSISPIGYYKQEHLLKKGDKSKEQAIGLAKSLSVQCPGLLFKITGTNDFLEYWQGGKQM